MDAWGWSWISSRTAWRTHWTAIPWHLRERLWKRNVCRTTKRVWHLRTKTTMSCITGTCSFIWKRVWNWSKCTGCWSSNKNARWSRTSGWIQNSAKTQRATLKRTIISSWITPFFHKNIVDKKNWAQQRDRQNKALGCQFFALKAWHIFKRHGRNRHTQKASWLWTNLCTSERPSLTTASSWHMTFSIMS